MSKQHYLCCLINTAAETLVAEGRQEPSDLEAWGRWQEGREEVFLGGSGIEHERDCPGGGWSWQASAVSYPPC